MKILSPEHFGIIIQHRLIKTSSVLFMVADELIRPLTQIIGLDILLEAVSMAE
jgi:hypothetical protein